MNDYFIQLNYDLKQFQTIRFDPLAQFYEGGEINSPPSSLIMGGAGGGGHGGGETHLV